MQTLLKPCDISDLKTGPLTFSKWRWRLLADATSKYLYLKQQLLHVYLQVTTMVYFIMATCLNVTNVIIDIIFANNSKICIKLTWQAPLTGIGAILSSMRNFGVPSASEKLTKMSRKWSLWSPFISESNCRSIQFNIKCNAILNNDDWLTSNSV